MAREDIPWLVKSSGRILGPFPHGKIIELLRTREISVLDEVSEPMRRWQTIQYHDDFRAAIESLRKATLSEKTEATWTPSMGTSNLTQTVTDLVDSELTDELTGDIDGFTASATPREIVIHNLQEQTHVPQPQPAGGRFQPQQSQNTAIQRQVEKTARGLWILTVIILLGVGAFIIQRRLSRGIDTHLTLSTLKQNVIGDVRAGEYTEALHELKSFYPDPSRAGDLAIYYGALLVQVEGQTVVGKRLLNTVVTSHRPEIKEAYTSMGLADLLDNQLDSAQDNFDKAIGLDNTYIPALLNLAAVAIQKGDYVRAKNYSNEVLRQNPSQAEGLLTLAEAQLYLYKRSGNTADLSAVNRTIKDYLAHHWDYSSELGFYSLYFDFLKQDRGLDDSIREYLDRDPELTADHRHSLFVYHGRSQWKVLARLCEQMSEKLGDGPRISAFLASCYAHETQWDQARRNIEKSVQEAPKDALVQAWFSYILRETGDAEQASVILGNAQQLNRKGEFLLPILLQARFYEASGAVDSARDAWQRIYERDLENLPAVAGLAWVNAQKGARGEALKYVEKGLKISPEYLPLLQLRQKAEKEGWYVGGV